MHQKFTNIKIKKMSSKAHEITFKSDYERLLKNIEGDLKVKDKTFIERQIVLFQYFWSNHSEFEGAINNINDKIK